MWYPSWSFAPRWKWRELRTLLFLVAEEWTASDWSSCQRKHILQVPKILKEITININTLRRYWNFTMVHTNSKVIPLIMAHVWIKLPKIILLREPISNRKVVSCIGPRNQGRSQSLIFCCCEGHIHVIDWRLGEGSKKVQPILEIFGGHKLPRAPLFRYVFLCFPFVSPSIYPVLHVFRYVFLCFSLNLSFSSLYFRVVFPNLINLSSALPSCISLFFLLHILFTLLMYFIVMFYIFYHLPFPVCTCTYYIAAGDTNEYLFGDTYRDGTCVLTVRLLNQSTSMKYFAKMAKQLCKKNMRDQVWLRSVTRCDDGYRFEPSVNAKRKQGIELHIVGKLTMRWRCVMNGMLRQKVHQFSVAIRKL